jgi:hypothetical protein
MKTKLIILAVLGLLLLTGIGWATRYRYEHLNNGLIRINIYTGEACQLEQMDAFDKAIRDKTPYQVKPEENPLSNLYNPNQPQPKTLGWNRCGR